MARQQLHGLTRAPVRGVRRVWRDNALSIVTLTLFLVFWLAQSLVGLGAYNNEQTEHGEPPVSYVAYLGTSHFWEASTENWESEFLQMGLFVVLTIHLRQRGSSESNPYPEDEAANGEPGGSLDPDEAPGPVQRGGLALALYRHSLSIVLLALFLLSFVMHAVSGAREFSEQQVAHGEAPVSVLGFVSRPEFWFQSLQNWQSEFLAIGAMVVLTIFLRQVGSSQSKPVEAPHHQTGSGG